MADLVAGRYGDVNYKVIPSVVYTQPEIAWVGQTGEQVKASGLARRRAPSHSRRAVCGTRDGSGTRHGEDRLRQRRREILVFT